MKQQKETEKEVQKLQKIVSEKEDTVLIPFSFSFFFPFVHPFLLLTFFFLDCQPCKICR